ncbi:MAG TPA: 2OG-Fe(II) oxygenase [Flavobacteriaceae bacterium]|nr:2OG-Fe(II) oxygenase [Flavobacteriaceae bacterium]
MSEIFNQLDFVENPQFERIISGLLKNSYAIEDAFFSEEEEAKLQHELWIKYHNNRFKKAAIGNKTNENIVKTIRGDFILWIDEAQANENELLFFNKINSLISYLNKTCFLGILQKEFHYALYPEGTFYKRHLDTFQNDDRRKLSFVFYLNDKTWNPKNGGELVLYLKKNNEEEMPLTVHPLPGRVVIFESQELEHEVKPVLKSQRLSVTGWLKTR